MDDPLVHTIPNQNPTKMDVLPKCFVQIILAAKYCTVASAACIPVRPPTNSENLCVLFCLYPSSMLTVYCHKMIDEQSTLVFLLSWPIFPHAWKVVWFWGLLWFCTANVVIFYFTFKKFIMIFFMNIMYKYYEVKQTKKNIPKYYQPNTTLHTVHMCNVAYALRNAKSKIHKRLTMKEDDSIL